MQFSPAVEAAAAEKHINPKQMQSEIKKQIANTGIRTKSQQALKLQHDLKKLGMPEWQAYRNGNTRKGYWTIAGSGILHTTITNERLARCGYYDISGAYKSMHSI